MDKVSSIFFEQTNQTINVEPGQKLIDICDEFDTPILFGCRACSCATCLIEITSGKENLNPITEEEAILLSLLAQDNDKARLACQCIINGSISIKTREI